MHKRPENMTPAEWFAHLRGKIERGEGVNAPDGIPADLPADVLAEHLANPFPVC